MCINTEKSFLQLVIKEARSIMELRPSIGNIHSNGTLPPRAQNPERKDIINALGATLTVVRQTFDINPPERFWEGKIDPKFVSLCLLEFSMKAAESIKILKNPLTFQDFGKTRVYLFVFASIFNLFVDQLVGRPNATEEFKKSLKDLEDQLYTLVLMSNEEMESAQWRH